MIVGVLMTEQELRKGVELMESPIRYFDQTLRYTVELREMEDYAKWKPRWYAVVHVWQGDPLYASVSHTSDLAMTMHHLITEVLPPFLLKLRLNVG